MRAQSRLQVAIVVALDQRIQRLVREAQRREAPRPALERFRKDGGGDDQRVGGLR